MKRTRISIFLFVVLSFSAINSLVLSDKNPKAFFSLHGVDNFFQFQPETSSSSVIEETIYSQNFNEDILEENPSGWTIFENELQYQNIDVRVPYARGTPFSSNVLCILDAQGGSAVYGYRDFGKTVKNGRFEFNVSMYCVSIDNSHPFAIHLQDSLESDIIKIDINTLYVNPNRNWTIEVEDQAVGGPYNNVDSVYVRVEFIEGLADVYLNETLVCSDISFTSGDISRIRLDTTDIGSSGECYFDDFSLTKYEFVPDNPTLHSLPGVDYNGRIRVEWTIPAGSHSYTLYRNTQAFSSTAGLIPIYEGTKTYYEDTGLLPGIYYYAVISENASGTSELSPCEVVCVEYPILRPIIGVIQDPNENDTFIISWSPIPMATGYRLYRNNEIIKSTLQLTPIYEGAQCNFTQTNLKPRNYFFLVVATNGEVETIPSECISVTINHASVLDLFRTYFWVIIGIGSISIVGGFAGYSWRKSYKRKNRGKNLRRIKPIYTSKTPVEDQSVEISLDSIDQDDHLTFLTREKRRILEKSNFLNQVQFPSENCRKAMLEDILFLSNSDLDSIIQNTAILANEPDKEDFF